MFRYYSDNFQPSYRKKSNLKAILALFLLAAMLGAVIGWNLDLRVENYQLKQACHELSTM